MSATRKKIVAFTQPFELAGFDEVLPAGLYEIEAELPARTDNIEPNNWMSSVLVHLHPRPSHPGLSRTLTIPLAALDCAILKDKFPGGPFADRFLEEMLIDPMIRLVMQAYGVSDDDIRGFYSGGTRNAAVDDGATHHPSASTRVAGLEGMSPRPGSPRPGIGE